MSRSRGSFHPLAIEKEEMCGLPYQKKCWYVTTEFSSTGFELEGVIGFDPINERWKASRLQIAFGIRTGRIDWLGTSTNCLENFNCGWTNNRWWPFFSFAVSFIWTRPTTTSSSHMTPAKRDQTTSKKLPRKNKALVSIMEKRPPSFVVGRLLLPSKNRAQPFSLTCCYCVSYQKGSNWFDWNRDGHSIFFFFFHVQIYSILAAENSQNKRRRRRRRKNG